MVRRRDRGPHRGSSVTPDKQLTLDFAAADAARDDQPFGEWLRSFPPTPWAAPSSPVDMKDDDG
jgi:hypothetical protein